MEYLRGILGECHAKMARVNKEEANKLSVKLELLADYYAGCWAHYDNEKYQSLTDGDIEEAIDCAEKSEITIFRRKHEAMLCLRLSPTAPLNNVCTG